MFVCSVPCNEKVLRMMRRVLFIMRNGELARLIGFVYGSILTGPSGFKDRPPFADGSIRNGRASQAESDS